MSSNTPVRPLPQLFNNDDRQLPPPPPPFYFIMEDVVREQLVPFRDGLRSLHNRQDLLLQALLQIQGSLLNQQQLHSSSATNPTVHHHEMATSTTMDALEEQQRCEEEYRKWANSSNFEDDLEQDSVEHFNNQDNTRVEEFEGDISY